jgi:DNA-binding transcriptional ArsR family regulator
MLATYAKIPSLADCEKQVWYDEPAPIDREAILKDVDSYLDFLRTRFDAEHLDAEIEAQAYSYVLDPPAMQELIVSHLRKMWDEYLASEWERVAPMLQDAVKAFRQMDLSKMSKFEAAQLMAGQELEREKWERKLERAEQVVFVPSAHVGPYVGKLWAGGDTLWMFFGARLPEGVAFDAPDLSRAEIVVRLSALADDNRLRILKLISEKGEPSSQDIMASLGLSQSAASRHLKQLSASGYLSERRCNVAKCYQLNPERIENTAPAAIFRSAAVTLPSVISSTRNESKTHCRPSRVSCWANRHARQGIVQPVYFLRRDYARDRDRPGFLHTVWGLCRHLLRARCL